MDRVLEAWGHAQRKKLDRLSGKSVHSAEQSYVRGIGKTGEHITKRHIPLLQPPRRGTESISAAERRVSAYRGKNDTGGQSAGWHPGMDGAG